MIVGRALSLEILCAGFLLICRASASFTFCFSTFFLISLYISRTKIAGECSARLAFRTGFAPVRDRYCAVAPFVARISSIEWRAISSFSIYKGGCFAKGVRPSCLLVCAYARFLTSCVSLATKRELVTSDS